MIEPGMRTPPADVEMAVTEKYVEAVNLNAQIHISAQAAQQNLYDMCMGFKKMRDDKLYKELGYDNFGDYCEQETGINRNQAYKYITVVENLPSDFVSSRIQNVGVTKLVMLAKLSDEQRQDLVENTDLESATVRELKSEIEKLKSKQNILQDERDRAIKQNNDASHQVFMADKKVLEMKSKVSELESEIKELENRPIEVAVETDSKEVADLKDAMKRVDLDWAEKYSQLEEQNLKERRELLQKIDKIKNQETPAVNEQKLYYDFCVKQAEKALNTLIKACLNYNADHCVAELMVKDFLDKMEEIKNETL